MKKVFIGVGHGGSDPGAVGYLVEKVANLEIALACAAYLTKNGVDTLLSRQDDRSDSLNSRITKCNEFKPDLALDIHNNSGGGDGFEVYYHYKGGISLNLAKNIETEVLKIGQNSRGCKTKLNDRGTDYFGFIRETNAPAVIVEGAFIDNLNDVSFIDEITEQRKLGEAYAKGILKTLGINTESVKNNTNTQNVYRVQAGAFTERANAEKLLKELKQKGFKDAFII